MQAQFFDLYRSGMKTAAAFAKTSVENTVRLQQKQLDMVRNILEENARSAERLGEAKSMEDLVGVQSQLAGAQFQRIAEFWTGAWQLAAEQWQSQLVHTSDAMHETARSSEEVARVAAAQISRASGSLRESAAPQPERKEPHRKSA